MRNINSRIRHKIRNNLQIYKRDIKVKGIYWSIIHRLLKIPTTHIWLLPIINKLKPKSIMIHGNKLYVDSKDSVVSEVLISEGRWEDYLTKTIKKYLEKGNIVIDVGAHIGYYSTYMARLVGKTGKVYAFEPEPHNFKLLERNVKENKFSNIILENKAVSDHVGKSYLYLNEKSTGDNRIFYSNDNREKIVVDLITLDEYFKNIKKKVDLIKIDVQGVDLKVLKGAKKILDSNKHIKIAVELYPEGLRLAGDNDENLLKFLDINKFKIFYVNEVSGRLELINIKKFIRYFRKNNIKDANLFCVR